MGSNVLILPSYRPVLRPVGRENDVLRCPWAKHFLPGEPGFTELLDWNKAVRQIKPSYFLVIPPDGQYFDKNGSSVRPIELWEHIHDDGTAIRLFAWVGEDGRPRPFDERFIEEAIHPRDRQRMEQGLAKKIMANLAIEEAAADARRQRVVEETWERAEKEVVNDPQTEWRKFFYFGG